MTNEMIRAKVNDIKTMDENELSQFCSDVSTSSVDAKIKWHLFDKIDERSLELRGLADIQGASVVMSEVKEVDL